MGRYVARRLLQMIPVFIGTTLLIFMMMYALPGDPVRAMYGDQTIDVAQIAAIKKDLGLDQPLLVQYLDYLWNLLHGDFGTQIASRREVSDVIADAFPVTIRLAVLAWLFTLVVGVGMGVIAGLRAGRRTDRFILLVTLLLISVPPFVLGKMVQTFFGQNLKWITPTVQNSEDWTQLFLPAAVLAALSLAYVARLSRTSIAENARADYMRTAVAKGLPRRRIVSMHLMRNSMIPVVTYLGVNIGDLMAGAVITEGIFNIQGIGRLVFEALGRREGATVVGIVTVLVLVYLAVNLIVDLLYAVLDPRIRYA